MDSSFVSKAEPYDDAVIFGEDLTGDDQLFQPDWGTHDETPYEGLYSTPLSWDPPAMAEKTDDTMKRPPTLETFNLLSTLTPAQKEKLRSIAMPEHLSYPSESSPESLASASKAASVSSPEQDNRRKRKSSADDDDDDDEDGLGQHPPVKKTAHNMIEKRYRTNLNDKIAALRDSVPSLRVTAKSARGEDVTGDREDLQGLTPAHKLNKATVLSKATEYIRHLEKRNNRLNEENQSMKSRIAAFEKLFLAGSMGMNPNSPPTPYQFHQDAFATPSPPVRTPMDAQGMIQVPDDMRMLHAPQLNQPIYPVPAVPENYQRPMPQQVGWNNGYFGKLVVGSLAGLLIMEGFNEAEPEEGPNARGLSALPYQLVAALAQGLRNLGDVHVLGYHMGAGFTWLKFLLLCGALLYVFVPSLFASEPTSEKQKTVPAAVSVASPIHVRQQAWLTAIQTVWVPRHNFFLEAAALLLKMLKLSMRNLVGWYGYSLVTGITEQEEKARVKSWEIAIDAQLTGGDVEINRSRLILTLMASYTLPHTPARCMLRAVHFRALLCGMESSELVLSMAKKLARRQWADARELQQLIQHTRADSLDALPDHLRTLLNQECDDVLSDHVVQRIYNLAWNLPTDHDVVVPCDGMNGILEDLTIRSPLDAVASWYSSILLQAALADSLTNTSSKNVGLAISVAPIGSVAQLRAVVCRAVLADDNQEDFILKATQALDPVSQDSALVFSPSVSSLPDLQMSVRCAMAVYHLRGSATPNTTATQALINKIDPSKLTLLGFAAAFKLMVTLNEHDQAAASCSRALEKLSCSLRRWMGGPAGAKTGLDMDARRPVIETCLTIAKQVVGMKDAGYESMTDPEDNLGGC